MSVTHSTDNSAGTEIKVAGPHNFLIVGIGASAGGIEALKEFFAHVPMKSGIAYVVILHLSPDHDSQLAEILQSSAKIPVTQVRKKIHIKPDRVYVVPPNQHLTMEDGHLVVTKNILVEERRAPVDIFFRTLAESHGELAICVILSGTGANGSMGLRRVKECGGAAFVQDPKEAQFDEMPRNSIRTGLVDEILPVASIPEKILQYKKNLGTLPIPVENAQRPDDQQKAIQEIFTQLRIRTGHDFINYKRPTLLRRIERRIYIRNLPDLPAYAAFLQQHPDEKTSLLKDLLISVTNFFRDPKAFEVLREEVIPLLFQNKTAQDQVRIWVAGCATGEEAYSIAMLCAERTMHLIDAPRIQIFATDIDDAALSRAREGFFTINDAADVSQERLNNFFNKDGEGYRIRREIREMILFANHNFIKDPPFSRLDMVSCRNVLIYLNQTAQSRVMETFHFALLPGGFLFLGTSESTDRSNELYSIFHREQHIFRSNQLRVRKSYPVPESVPRITVEQPRTPVPSTQPENQLPERNNLGQLHQRMLEEYAPPSLIINEEFDILHLSERAGRYLQIAGGEISQNLIKLIRPELRLEAQAALYQALQLRSPVETRPLTVTIDEKNEGVTVIIRPVFLNNEQTKGFILVLFRMSEEIKEEKDAILSDEPVARHLEEELIRLKAQLRSSNEQHELYSEEQKASHEELQAMNEELRSAAEELETSKEELQSINEELRTVNQEMKIKIEETGVINNNLRNLINSADVGTIFLDRSFRISLFTPSARDIFNLIPADYGRPLSDITNRLTYKNLLEDAGNVLQKLHVIEREVETTDHRIFMMRILPYRTLEDQINGVVLTFFDISERKKIEISKIFLASIVESSQDSIVTINFDNVITSWNKAAEQLYGYEAEDAIGKPLTMLTLPAELKETLSKIEKIKQNETVEIFDTIRINKKGHYMNLEVVLSPIKDVTDKIMGVSTIARDVTKRRQAEALLEDTQKNLDLALNAARMGIWDMDLVTGKIQADTRLSKIFGYPDGQEEWSREILRRHILPEDKEKYDAGLANAVENGVLDLQVRILWPDGSRHWIYQLGHTFYGEDRRPLHISGMTLDITERKQIEETMLISEERNRTALQSAAMGAWDWNIEADKMIWNEQYFVILGLLPDREEKPASYLLQFVHPEDIAPVKKEWDKAVDEGGIFHLEFRIIRADGGEVRWMNGYGRVVTREEGISKRMVGVIYDITHRKMLEQQKDEFLSIASHELKTPVTSIKAYAQILRNMFEEDNEPQKAELLKKLDGQVDRLTNLIRTLLDNTKVFEGQMPLDQQPFNLNELIRERIEDLTLLSEHHRLIFTCEMSLTIVADRERIGEVVTNLISNAIKYSPNGGEVNITCVQVPEGVKVSVSDQGIGIPEELRKKVFGRFFRGSYSNNLTIPGMGLGLYIAAGIIHRHHGIIGVESELHRGSVFYFILPTFKSSLH